MRPDLTYLTQTKFNLYQTDTIFQVRDDKDKLVAYSISNDESHKYIKPISKLNELVQLAEMLFDMTLNNPNSLVHLSASKVLEDLRIDEKNTSKCIEISKGNEKFIHDPKDPNFDKLISELGGSIALPPTFRGFI